MAFWNVTAPIQCTGGGMQRLNINRLYSLVRDVTVTFTRHSIVINLGKFLHVSDVEWSDVICVKWTDVICVKWSDVICVKWSDVEWTDGICVKWFCFEVKWIEVKWSELRWSSWGQSNLVQSVWPYTEGTWLYCDYFIWCVSCTVVVLTGYVMCGCVFW